MAYQKTEYKNNEQPALSAKNLNKNENAIKQQSLWKKLACLEDATYILNMEDYALEEGSFLAVYFEAALDETKKLIIQFNGDDYEVYSNQKQYFGSDVREQMILLCFKDNHFELFSSQSSSTSKQIGEVGVIYSDEAPYNCKIIDGFEWNRKEYPKLWEYAQKEINKGNQLFTEGNGSTTFKVLQPNFPVSKNNETEFNTLGKQGGEKKHTLIIDELPTNITGNFRTTKNETISASIWQGLNLEVGSWSHANASVAGITAGQSHNNLPPYTVVNYWICYDHEPIASDIKDLDQEVQELNYKVTNIEESAYLELGLNTDTLLKAGTTSIHKFGLSQGDLTTKTVNSKYSKNIEYNKETGEITFLRDGIYNINGFLHFINFLSRSFITITLTNGGPLCPLVIRSTDIQNMGGGDPLYEFSRTIPIKKGAKATINIYVNSEVWVYGSSDINEKRSQFSIFKVANYPESN